MGLRILRGSQIFLKGTRRVSEYFLTEKGDAIKACLSFHYFFKKLILICLYA